MSKIPDGWVRQPDGSYSPPKRASVVVSGKEVQIFKPTATVTPLFKTASKPDHSAGLIGHKDGLLGQVINSPGSDGGLVSVFVVGVAPCPAPRMTRRDKWLKPRRPAVQRYFDFRDALRATVGVVKEVPDRVDCEFYFAMPDSWSEKKKKAMDGKPHRAKPDRDNCDKAVCDALFAEDSAIHEGSQKKRWCRAGQERVEIKLTNYPKSC